MSELGFDPEAESRHWLTDEELELLVGQTQPGYASTVRAMATELLVRRAEQRGQEA